MQGWSRYVPTPPYRYAMTDDANPFELDLDGLYERYLVTCRMSGASERG